MNIGQKLIFTTKYPTTLNSNEGHQIHEAFIIQKKKINEIYIYHGKSDVYNIFYMRK